MNIIKINQKLNKILKNQLKYNKIHNKKIKLMYK